MSLDAYGWDAWFAARFAPYAAESLAPARIISEHKTQYIAHTAAGEIPALVPGKLLYETADAGLPAAGDWVAARLLDESEPKAIVQAVLPRRSKLSRREPGMQCEQVLAANVDTVFLVVGLDGNFSARRIERYLTMAWESGCEPVVLLTKADLCADAEERLAIAQASAPGAPVHVISTVQGSGLAALEAYLQPGRTLALLGSSGVGKSTLINYLLGQEIMPTQAVRADDSKGRHTTTHRQLFRLPSGALMLDTPGLRELQLWAADDGLAEAFPDIQALAAGCRYADCRHAGEPGCRVQDALDDGALDPDRFASFQKLQRELAHQARMRDAATASNSKRRWKEIHKSIRHFKKG